MALQSVALNHGHADEEEAMRCIRGEEEEGGVRRTKKRAEMTFFFRSYLAVSTPQQQREIKNNLGMGTPHSVPIIKLGSAHARASNNRQLVGMCVLVPFSRKKKNRL